MTQKSFNLVQYIRKVFGRARVKLDKLAGHAESAAAGASYEPVHKRVSLIIHNPRIPSLGNRKLNEAMNWNDPDELTRDYIADLQACSYGYANYQVVERVEVDSFPVKEDGFVYRPDDFAAALQGRRGFHQPDLVDYGRLLAEFDMIAKVNSGEIDEFWLFAFPYAGYYESTMGGPDAFWCNSPPLPHTAGARRRFIIMGFNYERGVGEMLEAFGHRAESIMRHVFHNAQAEANLWERFARYDQTHPGQAEVGIMHFAPNSVRDYNWGNTTKVLSRCDDWYNFPNLTGQTRLVDCREWGDGDIRAHHKWWFRHLPHVAGSANSISHNWWQYIIDPNRV